MNMKFLTLELEFQNLTSYHGDTFWCLALGFCHLIPTTLRADIVDLESWDPLILGQVQIADSNTPSNRELDPIF